MKIGIIGLGKVGSAFLEACETVAALQVVSVKAGRSPESAARLCGKDGLLVTDDNAGVLSAADVVLLTVPDGQIAAVAADLAAAVAAAGLQEKVSRKVCLHCSGSLGLEPLAELSALGIHCGSLHPLQSFAGGRAVFKGIGMAVDGDQEAQQAACFLASELQAHPFSVPASERCAYHAAACFCSNYLVTLTAIAQQLLARWTPDQATALQVLLPLLDGTVKNLHQRQLARAALTGPIARGDAGTVAGHLQVLPEELQSVYRELALQTVALAEANGSIDQAAAAKMQGLLRG